MGTFDRRRLLTTAAGAGAAFALQRWLEPTLAAADAPKQRIKIGQIGTGHEHASAKMSTLRKLSDYYEVVGIAESDAKLRKSREKDPAYQSLTWMGGTMTTIDMNTFFRRGIKLIGSTLRSRPSEMKARILADLERLLWQSFSSGTIKPVIYQALPIAQAEEAHAILQRRENIGKVVLLVERIAP